jgi:hypothetical protein
MGERIAGSDEFGRSIPLGSILKHLMAKFGHGVLCYMGQKGIFRVAARKQEF